MIFVTTGHQTPFDRLVRLMDEWSGKHPNEVCLAQIGSGDFVPSHMKWCRWMNPDDHQAALLDADLIVAHAGTGTILQTLELGKPILVLARKSELGETRNDHQIATVRELVRKAGVFGAVEEAEFLHLLDDRKHLAGAAQLGRYASPELLQRIRDFILSSVG